MYINERVTFPSFSMMRKKTLASIRWYLLRIALSLFLSLSIKKRVVKKRLLQSADFPLLILQGKKFLLKEK